MATGQRSDHGRSRKDASQAASAAARTAAPAYTSTAIAFKPSSATCSVSPTPPARNACPNGNPVAAAMRATATRHVAYKPASKTATAAIAAPQRATMQPHSFSTSVSGNASTRIGQQGRMPNTIAANAATAPAASVHISQPKAEVRQPNTRATVEFAMGADALAGEVLAESSKRIGPESGMSDDKAAACAALVPGSHHPLCTPTLTSIKNRPHGMLLCFDIVRGALRAFSRDFGKPCPDSAPPANPLPSNATATRCTYPMVTW